MGLEAEILEVPDKTVLLWQLAMLVVVTCSLFALFMPSVRMFFFPVKKRTKLADHLGYDRIDSDGRTVFCRGGARFQVVRVRGLDSDALATATQEDLFLKRKIWLHGLSAGGQFPFQGRLMLIDQRRVVDLTRNTQGRVSYFIDLIIKQYMRRFERSYRNTHYVVIVIPPKATHPQEQLETAVRNLVRQLGSVESASNSYGAEPLELGRKGSENSPLLSYLAQMVNPGFSTSVRRDALGENRVSDVVCQSYLVFKDEEIGLKISDGFGRFSHKGNTCWMSAVMLMTSSIRWGDQLPKKLLGLDQTLTVAQWVTPWDERRSRAYVKEFIKSETEEEDVAQTGLNEAVVAANLIGGSAENSELFFTYEMTVFVYGETRQEVVRGMNKVIAAIEDSKFTAVPVVDELDERWFSLHPPYQAETRPLTPMTSNVANVVCFPSPQQGYEKSDWGQRPVQFFHTASQSAYGFIFHALDHGKAPGHTALFGETGGGKTVLQNLLAASTLAHPDARVFIFDRYDSSYVFTKASGGKYIVVDTSHDIPHAEVARLNPFSLDLRPDGGGDTPFVQRWLSDHALGVSDADSVAHIARILRQMSKLPIDKRNMVEFEKECPEGSSVKEAAKKWVPGGEFGHVLSTKPDSLDFDQECRLFTFDATRFLENARISQTVIPYLSYRIETLVSRLGCPWLMIIDETKAMLQGGKNFAEWYLKLHDEARRLRGVIVSSFQRVSQAAKSGVLHTIREACVNHIYLPNPDADRSDYMDTQGLGDREFAVVKKLSDQVRDLDFYALLRRRNEGSVILTTDLSDLNTSEEGPLLQLFESGPEAANMYRACEAEYGEGEAACRPYLKRAAEILRQKSGRGFHLEEAAE